MISKKTILVIEDNELNSKLMQAALKTGHYHCLEACDATTGIHLAEKHKPDLILMDIGLPDMDGIEATHRLKDNPATSNIPVVAVTGFSFDEIEKPAKAAGICGYIPKPIHIKSFMETVKSIIL